jgi:3D (Asp-Asp-Asp) domain-containing protein
MIALTAVLMATLSPPAAPPPMRTATVTAYCSRCSGGVDQCGVPLRTGTVAADTWLHRGAAPAGALHAHDGRWRWYWVGDRVRFGAPLNATLTVRDCGGAIRGRDRFDLCLGNRHGCPQWGRRHVAYRVVEPTRGSVVR